jgi:hypothetical protein
MPEINTPQHVLVALGDIGLAPYPEHAIEARGRTALLREIGREQRRERKAIWRWGRPRGVKLAVSVAAVLAAAGGAYAALSSSSQLSAGIDCHSDAALNGSGTFIPIDGRRATELCAGLWAQGVLGATHVPPAPLYACVDPNGGGAIHVFASTDPSICTRVGLREDPQAGTSPAAAQYAKFQGKLAGWLRAAGSSCRTDAAVSNEVHDALAAADLTGWSVITRGAYTSQAPCASVAVDSSARTVTIVPIADGQ